jgi:thiol-disulfide isomerase/thioredoxin
MNDLKQNRKSLITVFALAVLAGGIGLYLQKSTPDTVAPAPGVMAPAPDAVGGFKSLAKGALAAFLVKPDRPAAPPVSFTDANGQAVSLDQWKGRVVLLNLWATWCAPCRKEMPTLADLQTQLGSKDFEVVALSVDLKGKDASSAFLKDTGVTSLALYTDPSGKALEVLQAIGLPFTMLVDRQGREIGRLMGPAEWNSPEAVALIKAAMAEGR